MELRTSTPVAGILFSPSLSGQPAPDCTAPQGRSVCQLSPVQAGSVLLPAHRPSPQRPSGAPDLADPQLPINLVASTRPPPESLVPRPRWSPTLKNAIWLSHRFQQPRYLPWIERQLERRRQTEQEGKEFCFPPLLTTLENMQLFIEHIQAGKQFDAPLMSDESRVLADLATKTTRLVQAGVPYKRTVLLAMGLTTLCALITTRQIFCPLRAHKLELFVRGWVTDNPIYMKPDDVTRLFWREGPPGPLDNQQQALVSQLGTSIATLLEDSINDNNIFVFPSFQALDLADFCRFSHLPLHPVGLITDYAVNADGYMMSPLHFAEHDLAHMHILRYAGLRHLIQTPAETALQHPDLRLAFRQLLLDRLPAPLAALQLKPALELLLFLLFHERSPRDAAQRLDKSAHRAFRSCLTDMAQARRKSRFNYSQDYQEVTDARAAMASLWTLRLWQYGQTQGMPLSASQLAACLKTFLTRDLPLLQEHLDFVENHRAVLRQLFFTRLCQSRDGEDGWLAYANKPALRGMQEDYLFQTAHRRSSVSNMDNTDLFYFEVLEWPEIRQMMQEKTRAPVPPPLVLAPPTLMAPGSGA